MENKHIQNNRNKNNNSKNKNKNARENNIYKNEYEKYRKNWLEKTKLCGCEFGKNTYKSAKTDTPEESRYSISAALSLWVKYSLTWSNSNRL